MGKFGIGSGSIGDLLDMLKKEALDDMDVLKTIPMKKEWKAKYQEFKKTALLAHEQGKKAESLRKSFWSTVELELNDFSPMRVNEDDSEIEILEDKDDNKGKKSVKSPIQMI